MKGYLLSLVGLLVGLIVLMFLLNQGKKLPGVGKVFGAAQDLAQDGQIG